jgi:hypothetical protein
MFQYSTRFIVKQIPIGSAVSIRVLAPRINIHYHIYSNHLCDGLNLYSAYLDYALDLVYTSSD